MSEIIKPQMSIEGQQRLIVELARQYHDPLDAFREYITNAMDAIDMGRVKEGLITILLDPRDASLHIQDNALGMDENKMRKLPIEIGESEKVEHVDARGEKAVGLWAFGSIGQRMHLISRTKGDEKYNHIMYEIKDKRPVVSFDRISERDMDESFNGGFDNGTKAVLNTNPSIFRKNLTPAKVKRFIQETYLPLLVTGRIPFWFGKVGETTDIIDAPAVKGEPIVSGKLDFEATSKGEMKKYFLSAHIAYDPDIEDGKVAVYSKDVRVYDSVLRLEEELSDCELWTCRQVSGFINEPNLSLTLGRDGINRNSNAYKGLVDMLQRLHEKHWPAIAERLQKRVANRGNKYVQEAWSGIIESYQVTEPINKGARMSSGDGEERERNVPINRNINSGQKEPGHERRRKFPFGIPIIREFDIHEMKLRSKLDTELGSPVVVINSRHPDYDRNVVLTTDPEKAREYVIDIVTPAIALWEAQDLVDKGGSLGDPYNVSIQVTRRAQDLKYGFKKR